MLRTQAVPSQAAPVWQLFPWYLVCFAIVSGWFIVGGLLGIGVFSGALGLRQSRQLGKVRGMSVPYYYRWRGHHRSYYRDYPFFVLGQQTLQECQKVGTPDGNGNKVCQVGDNPIAV